MGNCSSASSSAVRTDGGGVPLSSSRALQGSGKGTTSSPSSPSPSPSRALHKKVTLLDLRTGTSNSYGLFCPGTPSTPVRGSSSAAAGGTSAGTTAKDFGEMSTSRLVDSLFQVRKVDEDVLSIASSEGDGEKTSSTMGGLPSRHTDPNDDDESAPHQSQVHTWLESIHRPPPGTGGEDEAKFLKVEKAGGQQTSSLYGSGCDLYLTYLEADVRYEESCGNDDESSSGGSVVDDEDEPIQCRC